MLKMLTISSERDIYGFKYYFTKSYSLIMRQSIQKYTFITISNENTWLENSLVVN